MTSENSRSVRRIINSTAPIRICDNGGWTDTWFAKYGSIFNIAVLPCAEVQIEVKPHNNSGPRTTIFAENYGEKYVVHPEQIGYDKHPLIEAAIERMCVPQDIAIDVSIYSEAPVGGSMGTSASVTVALIGALDRLTPGRLTPHEIAYLAHQVETEMLGQECGIQDQMSAAYGGINYIDMFDYPHASVSGIDVPDDIWSELERRLLLIYLGKSHNSSKIHKLVIDKMRCLGPECRAMRNLRSAASSARDALYAGDFAALGRSMIDNTEAQGDLCPELIGKDAMKVIDIARSHGAIGWKVNGAGGDGGSMTILCGPLSYDKRNMAKEINRANEIYKSVAIYLSRYGLRVWETG